MLAAALALAAIAIAADLSLERAVAYSEALPAGRLSRLEQHRDPDEIPIFGASKAGSNYVPSVLGPKFYNYGLPAASLDVVNVLLEMELAKPSRQPVIIDLNQFAFGETGDPRNYLLLTANPHVRQMMQRTHSWTWYYAVPGLRFFGAWDWFAKGLLTDRIALTKRLDRGYEIKLDEEPWSAPLFARQVAEREKGSFEWGINGRQKAELLALVRRAPQRRFVLVMSPLHRSFFVRATGEQAFREELAEMERQAPNLTVIDMSRVDYPDTLFLNTSHLNQQGARVFSAELRRQLIARGVITP